MKKQSFIDSIRVKDPCTQAWDEMVGNDKVRFCKHCAKDVSNLSTMTRKEAIRLVRNSGGALCIRYVQNTETKSPMFVEELTQITRRRAPLMAAGVVTATLSLASLTYAQGGARLTRPETNPTAVSECEDVARGAKETDKNGSARETSSKTEQNKFADGALTGTVVDFLRAVVPNVKVTLLDATGRTVASMSTDEYGRFRFEQLAPGKYSLQTQAINGFNASKVENVAVQDHHETDTLVTLEISSPAVMGDMVFVGPSFRNPLTIAVSNNDLKEAEGLIARSENVNHKEEDGTTAIFVAVENGDIEMVKRLLDAGAKVNIRNKAKETPLMYLDEDATPELVNLLLRYGANVNKVSTRGDTALIRAARSARSEIIQILVDAGADLNAQNDEGVSALMNAADVNDFEKARILVVAGADVNAKDNEGETAWDKTTKSELEEFLETHGAITEDPDDGPR